MKCSNCGAELKVGCIYCSVCGKEAQIVPDYNLLEDEYLGEVLKEKKKPCSSVKKEEGNVSKKKKKKMLIAVLISVITIITAVFAIVCWIHYNNNHSLSWQIAQAEKYIEQKDYKKAVICLIRATELDDENKSVFLMLAETYQKAGETKDAIDACKKLLELEPYHEEAYKLLIALYDERKEYTEIQKLSEQVEDEELFDLFSDYLAVAPAFVQEPGIYHQEISVEIAAKSGCRTFYTTDGSAPEQGKEYQEPIELLKEGMVTIRAVSQNELGLFSKETKGAFNIRFEAPEKPVAFPKGGNFDTPQVITATAPEGCSIYYTWDGTDPTPHSEKYTEPLAVPEGNNILSMIAIDRHNLSSGVLRCNYIYIP